MACSYLVHNYVTYHGNFNTIFSLLREAMSPKRVSSQERQPSGKELLRYKNHTKLQMRIISLPKLKEGQILVLISLYNKNTGSCKSPTQCHVLGMHEFFFHSFF